MPLPQPMSMGPSARTTGSLPLKERLSKNKQEIFNLLAALWLPTKLAIIYCPGHQRTDTPMATGNQRADWLAKEAVGQTTVLALMLPDSGLPDLPENPAHTPADSYVIQYLPRAWQPQWPESWWMTSCGRRISPGKLVTFTVLPILASGKQRPDQAVPFKNL